MNEEFLLNPCPFFYQSRSDFCRLLMNVAVLAWRTSKKYLRLVLILLAMSYLERLMVVIFLTLLYISGSFCPPCSKSTFSSAYFPPNGPWGSVDVMLLKVLVESFLLIGQHMFFMIVDKDSNRESKFSAGLSRSFEIFCHSSL